jgi:hypothetical protein
MKAGIDRKKQSKKWCANRCSSAEKPLLHPLTLKQVVQTQPAFTSGGVARLPRDQAHRTMDGRRVGLHVAGGIRLAEEGHESDCLVQVALGVLRRMPVAGGKSGSDRDASLDEVVMESNQIDACK